MFLSGSRRPSDSFTMHRSRGFKSANVYGLESKNGSRAQALSGDDDSIRGLTVNGWIIIDEVARARASWLPQFGRCECDARMRALR